MAWTVPVPDRPSSSQKTRAWEFTGNERFQVLGRLGRGGMGTVYEVFDRELGMRLALKRLHTPNPEDVLRFKAEFRALRDVRHPNLVSLGELFEEDGRWFFTMELVDGEDFLTYVRGVSGPSGGRGVPSSTPPARVQSREAVTRIEKRRPDEVAPGHDGDRTTPSSRHRVAAAFDEDRLRDALAQLARGVDALHRAGKIHRDVKPSNVLVDRSGRVVLVDFGVVAEVGLADEDAVVGTVPYMAPEQGLGESVMPAADWYAVGTMLFEALTGELPFSGAGHDVLTRKLSLDAPPPSSLVYDVPPDLDELCQRLLARSPADRPTAIEVLRVFGAAESVDTRPSPGATPLFVGRTTEVARLVSAFHESRLGKPVAVFVEGPSGIGKSAALARAVETILAEEPRALVLRGRCHESETVPYNAFDGLFDDLSRHLRRLEDREPLPGSATHALVRLFPVLRSSPWLAAAVPPTLGPGGATVLLRREAVEQLRKLLHRLVAERPIVLVVEDIHWADAESVALLELLFRAPGAPPVCLLATTRPSGTASPVPAVASVPNADVMRLGGLSEGDARTLARMLLEEAPSTAADVDTLLAEARGHPMFLAELVRFSASAPLGHGPLQLDDALRERVRALDDTARAVLELVCASGFPLPETALARAAGSSRGQSARALGTLRAERLVRSAHATGPRSVEPYHDRVREAVYGSLDDLRRVSVHRTLGPMLERLDAPHELLVVHYERAGLPHRAAHFALKAGDAAAAALAFERAAGLYTFALDHGDLGPIERQRTLAALAEAQQNAGRPGDAARAFLAAAETSGTHADDAIELRRRAAEQFLMGGYLDEGLATAETVLRALGARLPTTTVATLVGILWGRLRLSMHRLRWDRAEARALSLRKRTRIDAFWSVGAGLTLIDTLRGTYFSTLAPLDCLKSGDEFRIARSLAAASFAPIAAARSEAALRLITAAERAAESHGSELSRFYAGVARAAYIFMVENDWRRFGRAAEELVRAWNATGRRAGWETDSVEQFMGWALSSLGELKAMAERVGERVAEAREMGNRFREAALRTCFAYRHLLRDAPDEAEIDVKDALALLGTPDERFTNAHYWALKSLVQITLYRGDVEERRSELDALWRKFDRSLSRRIVLVDMEAKALRAQYALACASRASHRGDRRAAEASWAEVERYARALQRCPLPAAKGLVQELSADLAVARGDEATAREELRAMLDAAEREGQKSVAAAMAYSLGILLGGADGDALKSAAHRYWAEQGIAAPERFWFATHPVRAHPDW